MTKAITKSEQIAVRLEPSQLAELDRLGEALERRGMGVQLSRAAIARTALLRGMEALSAELVTKGAGAAARRPRRK